MKKHPAAMPNHPSSVIAPEKKAQAHFSKAKTFSRNATFSFLLCDRSPVRARSSEKRKDLSRYHLERKKAGSRLRSLIKVTKTRRREDAQKLKAL